MSADYFLKIEGVDGESLDDKHKGSIELESFSWGATQKVAGGGGGGAGAGKVSIQDFHFLKKLDKSSPKLFLACCTGTHFPKVTLTARKAGKGQQEYLKIVLTDVMVSGFQTNAAGDANPIPSDQVTLNFAKFNLDYAPQKADGSLDGAVKVAYDVKANKSV